MKSTALVTGGAGALGSNLVKRLIREGTRVVVLDDLSSGHFPVTDTSMSRFVEGKVQDDGSLDRCFSEPIDVVFHLAALFANQNSVEHPADDLLANGLGTLKLLQRAHEAGIARFVYTSSSCVYAPSSGELCESSPLRPETPYACTKLLGEHYVEFFAKHHHLSAVALRLFNVFGPGEFAGPYRNVIPNFLDRARRGEDLIVTGDGSETRTFTFVEDVVSALLLAARSRVPEPRVFNVASDNVSSIRDLAQLVLQITGSSSRIKFAPRRTWDNVTTRRASWSLAHDILGYAPTTTLEDGLACTWEWLRKEGAPRR